MKNDANRSSARRWLAPALIALLALAPQAWAGAQDVCSGGGLCGASGLSSRLLGEAARAGKPTPEAAARAGARDELLRSEPARDGWSRYIPGRADHEDYNCALSFGAAAELSKKGFLGTRVLGQTKVWRAPDARN